MSLCCWLFIIPLDEVRGDKECRTPTGDKISENLNRCKKSVGSFVPLLVWSYSRFISSCWIIRSGLEITDESSMAKRVSKLSPRTLPQFSPRHSNQPQSRTMPGSRFTSGVGSSPLFTGFAFCQAHSQLRGVFDLFQCVTLFLRLSQGTQKGICSSVTHPSVAGAPGSLGPGSRGSAHLRF